MTLLNLAIRNILSKPLTTLLTVVLFATGLTIMILLTVVGEQLDEKYAKNRAGIDMVVGAKGGRLQLILSSIYHLDNPTGNISIRESAFLFRDPRISVIPMALGDNYEGYRIVGTDSNYVSLYQGKLEDGRLWNDDLEVTIGSLVAEELGLSMGDQFAGVHGMEEQGHVHEDSKYTIVGILEPSGTVLDQLILTGVPSVWSVHDHTGHDHEDHDHGDHEHGDHEHGDHEHGDHEHGDHEHGDHDHGDHDHGDHDHGGHDHGDHEHGDHEHDHTEDGHDHDHAHQEEPASVKHSHPGGLEHSHPGGDEYHEHSAAELKEIADNAPNESPEDNELPELVMRPGDHPLLAYPDKEITALLVSFEKSGAVLLQQQIDRDTEMMAAMTEFETQRLFGLIEPGVKYVRMLAIFIVIISGFSVFISLLKSLNERRYEIALMRVMGATRLKVFGMVILEGILLSLLGFVAGFIVSHGILIGVSQSLSDTYHYSFDAIFFSSQELNILLISIGIGFVASLWPAISAVLISISKTLTKK